MITYYDAVLALAGNGVGGPIDGPISSFNFPDGVTPPTEEQIQAKLSELKNAEPMQILREERNFKLAQTDWWCCSDRTPSQAQLDYRTALRDLPSNAAPKLNDNNQLTNVNWPVKPE